MMRSLRDVASLTCQGGVMWPETGMVYDEILSTPFDGAATDIYLVRRKKAVIAGL
jgi:hypothetical protein